MTSPSFSFQDSVAIQSEEPCQETIVDEIPNVEGDSLLNVKGVGKSCAVGLLDNGQCEGYVASVSGVGHINVISKSTSASIRLSVTQGRVSVVLKRAIYSEQGLKQLFGDTITEEQKIKYGGTKKYIMVTVVPGQSCELGGHLFATPGSKLNDKYFVLIADKAGARDIYFKMR